MRGDTITRKFQSGVLCVVWVILLEVLINIWYDEKEMEWFYRVEDWGGLMNIAIRALIFSVIPLLSLGLNLSAKERDFKMGMVLVAVGEVD